MDEHYWKEHWGKKQAVTAMADKLLQVRRTLHGKPIPQEEVNFIRQSVIENLDLHDQDRVLDLCCGNGLLTCELAQRAQSVTAVDFSQPLLDSLMAELNYNSVKHVTVLCQDALKVQFDTAYFTKIVMAGALQHFSLAQTVTLFRNAAGWLHPGGRFLVTDIPDQAHQWDFHDTPERIEAHFLGLESGRPVLGTWFSTEWLTRLALFAGFARVEVLKQPRQRSCAGYRVDLLVVR